MTLQGLGWVSKAKSHKKKLDEDKRRGNCPLWDVRLGDGNLVVGLNQVNFGENSAARHAVVKRLHVGQGVPNRTVTMLRRQGCQELSFLGTRCSGDAQGEFERRLFLGDMVLFLV